MILSASQCATMNVRQAKHNPVVAVYYLYTTLIQSVYYPLIGLVYQPIP